MESILDFENVVGNYEIIYNVLKVILDFEEWREARIFNHT